MFLFNKKTRNIIKYMWAVMAILIVFSMIFAYSGFTSLTQTTASQQQIEIPPEVQAQLEMQKNGSTTAGGKVTTPEEQAVLDAINEGRLDVSGTTTASGTPQAKQPPTETLKLEI